VVRREARVELQAEQQGVPPVWVPDEAQGELQAEQREQVWPPVVLQGFWFPDGPPVFWFRVGPPGF
jgi:hypothetical protein